MPPDSSIACVALVLTRWVGFELLIHDAGGEGKNLAFVTIDERIKLAAMEQMELSDCRVLVWQCSDNQLIGILDDIAISDDRLVLNLSVGVLQIRLSSDTAIRGPSPATLNQST